MIAVDSNILIRIALRDDREQAARSERLLADAATRGQRIAVSTTALVETVWAMRKPYKVAKSEITGFIRKLILNRSIYLLERDLIIEASELYNRSPVDFADCVISLGYRRAGVEAQFSFDSDAVGHGLFSPVPA